MVTFIPLMSESLVGMAEFIFFMLTILAAVSNT